MFKWAKNMIIWGEGGIVVHDPCAYYTHIVSGIFLNLQHNEFKPTASLGNILDFKQ